MPEKQNEVFISYISEDERRVKNIKKKLEANGLRTWTYKDLLPGVDWKKETEKMIEKVNSFLVCLSKLSLKKVTHLNEEIKIALARSRWMPSNEQFIFPLLLERDCPIHPDLKDIHHAKNWDERSFNQLLEALKAKSRGTDDDSLLKYIEMVKNQCSTTLRYGKGTVPLKDIFVRLNILEELPGSRNIPIEVLKESFDRERRGFGVIKETRDGIAVVNELHNLFLLGKPGSGKTTFLQYVALQATDGKLSKKYIPIFIELKKLSGTNKILKDFIVDQFIESKLPHPEMFFSDILKNGECLLLLDGLDELNEDMIEKIPDEITNLSKQYLSNQIIVSSRIVGHAYEIENFKKVEIADFNEKQMKYFINYWFKTDFPYFLIK